MLCVLLYVRVPASGVPYLPRTVWCTTGVSASQRPLVTALFKKAGFFREMAPIKGAVQSLHQMLAEGINVRLLHG